MIQRLAQPRIILAVLVLAGLVLRIAILLSPLGALEADEAVVGLMARHILEGDRPLFYWGQAYLGTLEAFTAAAVFAVVGASTLALKAVPTAYSLLYLLLSYLVARRLFGTGPALLTAGYLALPPLFLALWSTKPRGGYIEFLTLGEAALLAALWTTRASRLLPGALLTLALAGLSVWTHPLGVVYGLLAMAYVATRRHRDIPLWAALAVALAVLAGLGLFLRAYLANRLPDAPGPLEGLALAEGPANLARLLQIGGAVLVGLAQGSTSRELFEADWPSRPGSSHLVTTLLGLLAAWLLLRYGRSVVALFRPDASESASGPALLVGVLVLTPLVVAFTSFGQRLLIIEPRYALPLYSAVPLVARELWRLRRAPAALAAACIAVLAINAWSWLSADPRLAFPATIGPTTPQTRAALLAALEAENLRYIYTNYWLAYPLAFESGEWVIPSVISDGFNRYIPYAYWVSVADRPAWVFVADGAEERAFQAKLAQARASWHTLRVSIYRVYYDVDPVQPLRP